MRDVLVRIVASMMVLLGGETRLSLWGLGRPNSKLASHSATRSSDSHITPPCPIKQNPESS